MLERLNLLRNIGQFDSIAPGAQHPFERLTAIYAENGRGKTTLSAVMRSVASGNALPVQERHRLGAAAQPHVVLQAAGASHIFQNGSWSALIPTVVVFDDAFVADNVCSGLEIAADHRQNLHELILGAQGVALNSALQVQVGAIEEHNRRLREKADAIPAEARGRLSADQFSSLADRPNIDEELQNSERRLAAASSAAAIQREALFSGFQLPSFDIDAINAVLSRSIGDLDASAVEQVQAHFAQLGEHGERWVAEGVELIPAASLGEAAETCPFCEQPLASSAIFTHYRAYFGAAYTQLKQDISNVSRAVASAHSGDVPAAFERAVRVESQRRQFWSAFAEVPEINIDTAALARAWRLAREAVEAALVAKQSAPLDAAALTAGAINAVDTYHAARADVVALSNTLIEVNDNLEIVKEQAHAADVAALTADVATLRATQARYSAAIAPLCNEYLAERQAKTDTEARRAVARDALDNYRQNIFPRYQAAINDYLQRFGAGFRLQDMESVNTRGGSAVNYTVLINNNLVPLNADGAPSFRSALSSGDRNTLALAFFFASLVQHPNLADCTVIIDDPMTSLDEHRSLVTVQEICGLASRVGQVIVLSHFKPFLMKVWQDAPRNHSRASMRITRVGNASAIVGWDVNGELYHGARPSFCAGVRLHSFRQSGHRTTGGARSSSHAGDVHAGCLPSRVSARRDAWSIHKYLPAAA